MRVHQMTATLAYGDAISNNVFEIDRRLKAWGLDARTYAENIEPRIAHLCRPDAAYEPYVNEPDDLLIYHYSIYVGNLDLYRRSCNRRIVLYHNITPAEYFRGYHSGLEAICQAGRAYLSELQSCDLGLGVSEFDRRELIAAGVPEAKTDVLPIFLSLTQFEEAGRNAQLYARLKDRGETNLLYVGRIAPNKACEDLLKIFYAYRRYVNPRAHLYLVGSRSLTRYVRCLEVLVERLKLQDAVTFADQVPVNDLRTYYEASDVFLFASRHEGFGVPLLESMYFKLPVLAYHAAAVPETMGNAGVLFKRLSYDAIAEMLDLLVTDNQLREQIIRRQQLQLAEFSPERVEAKLRNVLERVGAV